MMMMTMALFFLLHCRANCNNDDEALRVGVLLPTASVGGADMYMSQAVIMRSIQAARRQLPNVSIELRVEDTRDCVQAATYAPLGAMRLHEWAHVFLGPVCNYGSSITVRFAKVWNIPVLTAEARVKAFNNKVSGGGQGCRGGGGPGA